MSKVLHFNPKDDATAVCGTRTYLVEEYTDNPHHVECGRCKRTKAFIEYDPRRFNVDVWNHEGEIIRWIRYVTADDVEMMKKEYADNPTVEVVVEEII